MRSGLHKELPVSSDSMVLSRCCIITIIVVVVVITIRFYKTLAMNMNNDHKSVYAAAAEVVGMSLALLADKETLPSDVELRRQYVDDVVKQLMDKKPDRFITCLHCIQLHFPAISDRFC